MRIGESDLTEKIKVKGMKRENGKSKVVMLGILCALMCANGATAKKKIRAGVDENGNEKHLVRLNDSESNDLAVEIYNDVKKSLALIKGKTGVGSGFVAEADGKRWIYTNEHVARIGHPLKAVFIDGTEVAFDGTIEVAEDRDVARIEFKGDRPALKIREDAPSVDELAFVYGNSAGGDVITKIVGMVLGVGDKLIEVSSKFVSGNSGSPILDGKGRVVGIATLATLRCDPKDWVKSDTRFNDVRRFGTRLQDVEWKSLEWNVYAKAAKNYEDFEAYRSFLIPVCFKNKQLVTDYNVKDVSVIKSVSSLRTSLGRLVKQDKEYLKAYSELEAILEKRKTMHPGSMNYPKKENINIRYRKLRRELLESILERKNALKTATTVLSNKKWPCKRIEDDAAELLDGFKYCCTAYDQFNDDSLSQIDWHVD